MGGTRRGEGLVRRTAVQPRGHAPAHEPVGRDAPRGLTGEDIVWRDARETRVRVVPSSAATGEPRDGFPREGLERLGVDREAAWDVRARVGRWPPPWAASSNSVSMLRPRKGGGDESRPSITVADSRALVPPAKNRRLHTRGYARLLGCCGTAAAAPRRAMRREKQAGPRTARRAHKGDAGDEPRGKWKGVGRVPVPPVVSFRGGSTANRNPRRGRWTASLATRVICLRGRKLTACCIPCNGQSGHPRESLHPAVLDDDFDRPRCELSTALPAGTGGRQRAGDEEEHAREGKPNRSTHVHGLFAGYRACASQ